MCVLMGSARAESPSKDLSPDPRLSPKEVVEFQLSALQHNDDPTANAGIEKAFRFASPANRLAVGPLDHFISIVHSASYNALINAQSDLVLQVDVQDSEARVSVRVVSSSGSQVFYLFLLSKQQDGAYANCWMTDGVIKVEQPGDSSPGVAI
jgi:hypothetical protein